MRADQVDPAFEFVGAHAGQLGEQRGLDQAGRRGRRPVISGMAAPREL